MTPKQERFVAEYLVDLNATQAAIRSGYSAKTAYSIGQRLLKDVDVASAIDAAKVQRQTMLATKIDISVERVARELALIGYANMADYARFTGEDPELDLQDLTRDQAAAISEIQIDRYMDGKGEAAREVKRVKFKLHDKRAALVDLGRHLGMFEREGGGNTTINQYMVVAPEHQRETLAARIMERVAGRVIEARPAAD